MARKRKYQDSASLSEKKRFARYLAEDEELLFAAGVSLAWVSQVAIIAMAFPGIIFVILGLILAHYSGANWTYGALVGILAAICYGILRGIIFHHGHRYLLTTRRVVIKNGFFVVDLTSALYDKITHIEVVQGLVDRFLLHHGKIIINTAGMNKNQIELNWVDAPIEFKNLLERLINREREHFGGTSGPVQTLEGELVD